MNTNEKKNKYTKTLIIVALLAIVVAMSVGYAALAQRLIVNGTTNVDAAWNIKIVEIAEIDSKVTGDKILPVTKVGAITGTTSAINMNGDTTASFDVQLNEPGDYAVFKVAIKNLGNIDGKLNAVTDLTTINAAAPEALKFTVTPDATNDEILNTNEIHYYNVRVDYTTDTITPDENITTESDNVTVNLGTKTATIHFDYIQG